jgi:hypothetical protein
MNDFHLMLVDWSGMISRFDQEGGARALKDAKENQDHQRLTAAAESFLYDTSKLKSSQRDREVDPHNFSVGSTKLWSALGATYGEIRGALSDEVREAFDALYLPFVAPWADGVPLDDLLFQLPESMVLLKAGGLSVAISPEHCKTLAALCHTYTFSFLVQHRASRVITPRSASKKRWWFRLLFDSTKMPQIRPDDRQDQFSWFDGLLNVSDLNFRGLHASFTELTEGWRKLITTASAQRKGILAVFEI